VVAAIGVILILTRLREIFTQCGFTTSEGFFLSFMMTLPYMMCRVLLYKKLGGTIMLPSISKSFFLNHAILSTWEAKLLLALIGLLAVAKTVKYVQMGAMTRASIVVLTTSLSTCLFLLLLKVNTYTSNPRKKRLT
jgi:hypothetical protein